MTKLTIIQDLETDANNWYEAVNSSFCGTVWKNKAQPDQKFIVQQIENKTKEEAFTILTPYLQNIYDTTKQNTEERVFEIQTLLNQYKEPILQHIVSLTKHPIEYDEIKLYMTTYPRCPYHRQKGLIRLFIDATNDDILNIIAHEILHFQFHMYYSDNPKVKLLNSEQFETIKESLTFLVNHEFAGIPLGYDKGYPQHQALRKQLEDYRMSQPEDQRDFEKLIEYGCGILTKV